MIPTQQGIRDIPLTDQLDLVFDWTVAQRMSEITNPYKWAMIATRLGCPRAADHYMENGPPMEKIDRYRTVLNAWSRRESFLQHTDDDLREVLAECHRVNEPMVGRLIAVELADRAWCPRRA